MIQTIASLVLLLAFQAVAAAHVPEWQNLSARICVEREENHGSMNIVPSRVRVAVADSQIESLYDMLLPSGGTGRCVLVDPGKYQIQVFAAEAYQRTAGPEHCTSSPLLVSLAAGGTAELNVWPKVGQSGYDPCGWEILPHGTPQSGHCMQSHRTEECERPR